MKKTVYFTSKNHAAQNTEQAIQDAVNKREAWLTENKDIVAKIDNEDLKFSNWNNGQHVFAIILLTYYPKI